MKKVFKFFMAAVVVAAGFTACSSDEAGPNPEQDNTGAASGTPTYATFSFKVNEGNATRAAMVQHTAATYEITDVKDIRLLIFKTGTSTVCEVNQLYADGDAGFAASKSATVQVTSGKKRIFVIANTKQRTRINTLLEGVTENTTTLEEFYNLVHEIGGAGVANFDITELLGTATYGMVMSNAADATSLKNLVAGITESDSRTAADGTEAKNNFKFDIYRVAAKGVVYYKDAGTLTTGDDMGTLSALKYGFRNVNHAAYLFQQYSNHDVAAGTWPQSPYYNQFNGMTDAQLEDQATYAPYYYSDYDYAATMGTSSAEAGSYYLTENTNSTQRTGNSTYAFIEASFTPKTVVTAVTYDAVNNKFTSVTTGAGSLGTFWITLKDASGLPAKSVFASKTLAETAVGYYKPAGDDINDYLLEYTNGKCYYRLNIGEGSTLNNDMTYGIKRNYIYAAQITKFATIGEAVATKLTENPETPLGEKTYVTAVITIIGWKTANSTNEL